MVTNVRVEPRRLEERSGDAALPITPPDVCDRTGDELLEHRSVEISQLLEVQTRLTDIVLAKLGQQELLSVSFRNQVHHQLAATDSKARQGRLPGASALVGVAVR